MEHLGNQGRVYMPDCFIPTIVAAAVWASLRRIRARPARLYGKQSFTATATG
jgi:hypothetical protein